MKPYLMTFAFNCGPWSIAHTANLERRELPRNEERPGLKYVAARCEVQDRRSQQDLTPGEPADEQGMGGTTQGALAESPDPPIHRAAHVPLRAQGQGFGSAASES